MTNITVNIRPSIGQIFQLDVDTESTSVQRLVGLIADQMGDIDATNIRLILAGRLLKNKDILRNCNVVNGCTIHVARLGCKSTTKPVSSAFSSTETLVMEPNLMEIPSNEPVDTSPATPQQQFEHQFTKLLKQREFLKRCENELEGCSKGLEGHSERKENIEIQLKTNREMLEECERRLGMMLLGVEVYAPGTLKDRHDLYKARKAALWLFLRSDKEADSERLAKELGVQPVPRNTLNTQALPNPWIAKEPEPGSWRYISTYPFIEQVPDPLTVDNSQSISDGAESTNNSRPRITRLIAPIDIPRPKDSLTENNLQHPTEMSKETASLQPITASQQEEQPLEIRFRHQLSEMESMGFLNRSENINALIECNGNMYAAMEDILSKPKEE